MPYLAYSLKSSIEKYYFRNQIFKPFFTDFRLAKLKPFSSKSRPSKPPRPPIFSPNRRKKHQKRAGFSFQNPRSRPAPTEYLITRSGRFARSRLRRRRKRKCQAAPRPRRRIACHSCRSKPTRSPTLGLFNAPHARPSLSKFWLKSRKLHKGP